MMLPPPCLTRRMVFMPGTHTKKLNLCLIRPDNFLSRGPRVLQVPFGRLQMCCRPCALWPLYHRDLNGGWLQRGLSFWKVLTRITTGFSVNSLTTQLSSNQTSGQHPASFRKGAGGSELLPLIDDGCHCAQWDLQSSRHFSVPFPAFVSEHNPVSNDAQFL